MGKTFDVKVVGYEAIQAENVEEALESFDALLAEGYTLEDLRWKSTFAYDVEGDGDVAESERLLSETRRHLEAALGCLRAAVVEEDACLDRVRLPWLEKARRLV